MQDEVDSIYLFAVLRESEYTQWVYNGLCGMNKMEEK